MNWRVRFGTKLCVCEQGSINGAFGCKIRGTRIGFNCLLHPTVRAEAVAAEGQKEGEFLV